MNEQGHLLKEEIDDIFSYNYAQIQAINYWEKALPKTIVPDVVLRHVWMLGSNAAMSHTTREKDFFISSKTRPETYCASAIILCENLDDFYTKNQVAMISDMQVAERYSYRDEGGCPARYTGVGGPTISSPQETLSSQGGHATNVLSSKNIYNELKVPITQTLWFSESSLISHVGETNALRIPASYFTNSTSSSLHRAFLPKKMVDSFGSLTPENTLTLLNQLDIPPTSAMAKVMQATAKFCEHLRTTQESDLGVERSCIQSIEDLADYVNIVLSKSAEPLKTTLFPITIDDDNASFKIIDIKLQNKKGSKVMACHSLIYAYQVFLCHSISNTRLYSLSLESMTNKGYIVNTLAFCHSNTTNWNPSHEAFQILGNKPGDFVVPCHLLSTNGIGFVQKVE